MFVKHKNVVFGVKYFFHPGHKNPQYQVLLKSRGIAGYGIANPMHDQEGNVHLSVLFLLKLQPDLYAFL